MRNKTADELYGKGSTLGGWLFIIIIGLVVWGVIWFFSTVPDRIEATVGQVDEITKWCNDTPELRAFASKKINDGYISRQDYYDINLRKCDIKLTKAIKQR